MGEAIPGSIIQINPDHDETFGGCLAIVKKVKSWGVSLCYVTTPGNGDAFYRVPHGAYAVVGHAKWVYTETEGENDD